MQIALAVIFVAMGLVVGSFLNVCADRLPAGGSIVFPPSHCPACGRRIRPFDTIPGFSYLALRGRCRDCGAPIPRRVLLVEIGTGLLFGLVFWRFGLSLPALSTAIFGGVFIVILITDLEHGLILNKVVYPALGLALAGNLLATFFTGTAVLPDIKQAAIGGGIALGLFLLVLIISRGGMGWGDVKMAALIGLVTGSMVFIALLLAIITGAVVSILLLAFKVKKRKESIPFGPFLSVAAVATMLYGNYILTWYHSIF